MGGHFYIVFVVFLFDFSVHPLTVFGTHSFDCFFGGDFDYIFAHHVNCFLYFLVRLFVELFAVFYGCVFTFVLGRIL